MRKMMFALAAFAMLLTAGVANAQMSAMPAGVHTANGALADASGKPLYTFVMDTMVGMSHCSGKCAVAWPPLAAAADAKPMGDWTVITREDGSLQWAYHDKPLYTFVKDTAGQPGTGEGQNWKLAH
jgi:predicted lipoprotein with Yx(FWY)xxD motif